MMKDQAQALRHLVARASQLSAEREERAIVSHRQARVIAVTSGKGGVGKSNFSLNFAIALQEAGYRALLFDADIGMANIDVLIGNPASANLFHVINGTKSLEDIVQIGPKGMHYISGGSGLHELFNLPDNSLESFLIELESWSERYDVILFDTGAGLSKESLRFIAAADETFVVTTPEPTAIADAYALIKVVHRKAEHTSFRLIVNRASDWTEGRQTADRILTVARRFLSLDIAILGYIFDDIHVMKAVKKQIPYSVLFQDCLASQQIRQLAKAYMNNSQQQQDSRVKQKVSSWLKRFTSFK
ncbi:MinD/ParA family protein [Paenibacillus agilis]|uniref:MinD/ParA family protein n=2 Tax=Paenibacillus agilis TaxID=3020863 RepID=A0A559J292_9BACL|nr:MinD/ParA family protein [Paenibacillus agilis]TVX93963.1 MinD/ParA family protein [Paenibacillus agilis]